MEVVQIKVPEDGQFSQEVLIPQFLPTATFVLWELASRSSHLQRKGNSCIRGNSVLSLHLRMNCHTCAKVLIFSPYIASDEDCPPSFKGRVEHLVIAPSKPCVCSQTLLLSLCVEISVYQAD